MEKFLEFIPEVVDFLNTESYFVDRQMWDEWLNLFSEDCEYWRLWCKLWTKAR